MTDWEFEAAPLKNFFFGKIGDYIMGRFDNVSYNGKDNWGKDTWIYEFEATEGVTHLKNDNDELVKTAINEEELWTVFARKRLHRQLKGVQRGQVVKIEFDSEEDTGKGNPAKIRIAYFAKNDDGSVVIDEDWLEKKEKENEEEPDF